MFFKLITALFILAYTNLSVAQISLYGKVVDADTGNPLENVTIHLNETNIGTKTNIDGRFFLKTNNSKVTVVVSCVGYEKKVVTQFPQGKLLTVRLKSAENILDEVVIQRKWEKWGELFTKLLMGDDSHSYFPGLGRDIILNKHVIDFLYDGSKEVLTVSSTAPLLVYNGQTGYLIKVQLKEFSYSFREDWLNMIASISIEETSTHQSLSQLQIATNNAYYGSLLHFCDALAKGTLMEEGFNVKKFIGIKNLEKERVLNILCNINNIKYALKKNYLSYYINEFTSNADTARYFKKILKQDDFISYKVEDFDISKHLDFDSVGKIYSLKMRDTLQITYLKDRKNELLTNISLDFVKQSKVKKYESLVCFTYDDSLEFNKYGKVQSNGIIIRGYMNINRLSHALPNGFKPNLPRVKVGHDALKNHAVFQDERP